MVHYNCNTISLIQIAAPTARTIFFNRDRFVWNDWSSTSLTTFTLLKSDMLTVDCYQAANKIKGKRKRFLSYNGFFKVARNCIELNCLIYCLWTVKTYDPLVDPLCICIIQHACDTCIKLYIVSVMLVCREQARPNPMSCLHSKATGDLRR